MRERSIYVAGASCDFEQIAALMRLLRASGWIVTRDWTEDVRRAVAVGTPDSALTEREALRLSQQNADGVCAAAWFWLVTPSSGKSEGAHFEYGLAHGLGKRILISGERTCIFQDLGYPRHTHDRALAYLLAIGQ